MLIPRRACAASGFVIAWALLGCDGGGDTATADVPRFPPRDAMIVPELDVAIADAVADAGPVVDVVLFDARHQDVTATSDGEGDAPPTCVGLSEDYAAAVHSAQTCGAMAACSLLACETLCCDCQVYLNPASPWYARVQTVRDEFYGNGCSGSLRCPPPTCAPPSAVECSSEGRCVTLRPTSVPADGGAMSP